MASFGNPWNANARGDETGPQEWATAFIQGVPQAVFIILRVSGYPWVLPYEKMNHPHLFCFFQSPAFEWHSKATGKFQPLDLGLPRLQTCE